MCLWPCCHAAIYRVDSTNGKVKATADWGSCYNYRQQSNKLTDLSAFNKDFLQTVSTGNTYGFGVNLKNAAYAGAATCVDSYGSNIYVGGFRCTEQNLTPSTASGLYDDGANWSVMAFNENLEETWRADVGGQVSGIKVIPRVGILVAHEPTYYKTDSITIIVGGTNTRIALYDGCTTPSVPIPDFITGSGITQDSSASVVKSKCAPNATVTGSSLRSGLSFKYPNTNSPLRPALIPWSCVIYPSYEVLPTFLSCPSIANLTMLDADTGEIIWRRWIGGEDLSSKCVQYEPDAFGNDYRSFTCTVPLIGGITVFEGKITLHAIPDKGSTQPILLLENNGTVSSGAGFWREADTNARVYGISWITDRQSIGSSGDRLYAYSQNRAFALDELVQMDPSYSVSWATSFAVRDSTGLVKIAPDATGTWGSGRHYKTEDGSVNKTVSSLSISSSAVSDNGTIATVFISTLAANAGANTDPFGSGAGWSGVCFDPSNRSSTLIKSKINGVCSYGNDFIFVGTRE